MTVCNIGSSIYNNKNLNEIINISVVAEEICSALHPEDIINSLSVSKNFNNQIKAILEIRLGGLIPAYPNLFNYLSDKVKAASNEMHQDAGKALKKYLNKMAFGNEVRAPQYGTQKIIEWFESIEPRGRGPASYLTWDGLDKLGVLSREDGVVAIRVAVEVVAEAARALSSEKTAEVVESVIIVQELEQIMARLDQAIQTAKILSMEKLIQIAGKARTAAQVAGQVAQTARSPIARQQAPLEVKKGYSAKLELERAIREIQEAQAIQAQEQNDQVLTPSQIHQEILDDNLINILSFHKKSDLINILNIDHQVLMDWCNTQLGDFIHLDELEKLMSMVKDEEIPFPVGRIGLTLFSYIQDKIKKGNKEIKEWWFKEKNYCDKNGSTLLHHAASSGKVEYVQLLLEKKVDVDAVNDSGNTALHWAAWQGECEVAKLLLEKKANPDIRNILGNTVLHFLVSKVEEEDALFFIKNSNNLNAQNKEGDTPLHWAAKMQKKKIINFLLEAGADSNIPNSLGETASDWIEHIRRGGFIPVA